MDADRYFEQIVDPTIADFEANPTSVRHAFLAAVAVFHTIDYLNAKRDRKNFRDANADFALVDRIAHAFKHVHTGHLADPNLQPLTSEGVISRPAAAWDSAVWDMSTWDDAEGGVTLDSERATDVLSAIKGAALFVRQHLGPSDEGATLKKLDLGPRGAPRRRLTKQQAIRHLIHAAVRMIMAREDPFATHLLIQSADKLLSDLAKRASDENLFDWTRSVKPEYKDVLIKLHRETYNFLKHADRDHDQTLHVGDIGTSNILQLGVCITNYQRLFGEWTDHMQIGFAIARFIFPDGFISDDQRQIFRDAVSKNDDYTVSEFISHIRTLLAEEWFPKFQSENVDDLQDVVPFFERTAGQLSFPAGSDGPGETEGSG
jgi:hypothetical protein